MIGIYVLCILTYILCLSLILLMEPTTFITLLPLLVCKINFLFTLRWQQAVVSIWLNKDDEKRGVKLINLETLVSFSSLTDCNYASNCY